MTDDLNAEATNAEPPHPLPAKYLLMADILHMMVAYLLLSLFLFTGTEVPLLFQLALSAVIFVVMIRGGGWLALAAMQVSMFFYETRVDEAHLQLPTIVFAVVCLAFIAYATGFRTIRRWLREWLGRGLQELIVAPPYPGNRSMLTEMDARRERLAEWQWLSQQTLMMLLRSARLLLIVLVASLAFLKLPFTRVGVQSWWDRSLAMDMVLWPGANVFTVAIVCLIILTIGSWRQLSVRQARLYLKSLYVREHYRELRSILVRGKFLSEPIVSQTKPVKATAVSVPPVVAQSKNL